MIRCASPADIPWMLELCRTAYPRGYYDYTATEGWFNALMQQPNVLLLRGERSWLGVAVASLPWKPTQWEARFLPIVSSGKAAWELVGMTDRAIVWARRKGAQHLYFSALTGVDLGPLARRFGAVDAAPSYVLDLGNV